MMTEINYKKLNAWMWFIFLGLIIVMSFALITLHRWIGEPSAAFHVVMLIFTFCLLITVLMAVCMYLILKSHEKSKSLFDNEQRYKMILDSIKDIAIFTLTPLGHVKSWNFGAQRVYGYADKEIVGKHFSLFYPREDAAKGIPLNVISIAKTKGKFEGEVIRIRKDGSPFWAHVMMEPIYNDKQRLAGFVNITRDVTENRKMEEEHSRLIALIEESSDFVGIADLQGNLLYHNRSAKQMVGLPEDYDISSLKISDMHPQWAVQKIINEVIPTAFEKGFWTGELALLHRSSREIPVLQAVTLHRNAMGEPVCLTTIARDITERKAEEDATKASEEIFRSAMQHASTGMALISPTGKWLKVNHSICSMLGYSEEELLQSDFQTLTHPDDLETDLENVLLMLNKQIDSYQMEKRYIHKDGHIVWGLLSVSLVWGNDGTPKYFVSLVQNISYRKKAEAANKKLLQALESSNAELERFAYVASHDLQEPIRMINSFGELLLTEKQDKLDDEGKEYLKIMTDAGLRMRAVINDLLAYSRVHEDAKNASFDGESALKSALENIKALIEEQKAQITHDPIPLLYGNPMQIMRVLQNLLTNAIKYQPPGNIPMIHIGVEDADPYWKITVQDNGLGIDEQFIKEIFEPFKRLHAWDSIKGSGLGLSICKKIAEHHNGSLSVASRVGFGSKFTLTLPKHDNILHA